MKINLFELERNQSLYENTVEYNLTESGVHPYTLRELFSKAQIEQLLDISLGYGYTEGRPNLRQAISTWYPGATPDNVLVTHGASEANFLALWSLLSPGDELLFILPNFMQLSGIARSFGITVKTVALRQENNWQLDLDEVRQAITPRTKMIACTNPNNPTGTILSANLMDGLVAIAREADIYLLADEIYRGSELNGCETPTFYGSYEKVIITSSTSKSLAHAGLRLGWIIAAEAVIYDAMCQQDYTTIGTGILNQWIAEQIMQPAMRSKILSRSHKILNNNLVILDQWVEQHSNLLSYCPPQATGMAFIHYNFDLNSSEFSKRLREKQSVFVVAGDWFGLDHYIRVGIGSDSDYLSDALQRINVFFDSV